MHRYRPLGSSMRWSTVVTMMTVIALMLSNYPKTLFGMENLAQQRPTMTLVAPRNVAVGKPIKLTLVLKSPVDVGGYETNVVFDTSILSVDAVRQRDSDLRRFGRDISPLGPTDLADGIALGFASCPHADCVRADGAKRRVGGTGTIRLATIILRPASAGRYQIALDQTKLVAPDGTSLPIDIATQAVIVQVGASTQQFLPKVSARTGIAKGARPAKPLDLTGDRQVTYADAAEAALAWTIARENMGQCSALIDATRDVNNDNCIDIADVQLVTAAATPATMTSTMVDTTLTVNATGDQPDLNAADGTCLTSVSTCTLRAAITEANAQTGPNTIVFTIPGSNIQTITVATQLPSLNDATGATTIDGYTQLEAQPNTSTLGSNATIKVELVGTGESKFPGLYITSADNVIRGLSLYKFNRPLRTYGSGAQNTLIAGNFIGTNAEGSYAAANGYTHANGIDMRQGTQGTRIGTPMLADRNVISGNAWHGVGMYDESTKLNQVINNIIGLSPAGNRQLANRYHGVDINGPSDQNTVGGTETNERNVISGNLREGIEISHSGSEQNHLLGNFIGTDLTGTSGPAYAANGYRGINLEDGVKSNLISYNVIGNNARGGVNHGGDNVHSNTLSYNRIGVSLNGTAIPNGSFGVQIYNGQYNQVGPGNIIANNAIGVKITQDTADNNRVTQNSIYNASSRGIDLAPHPTVNSNDVDDLDKGPNEQLNFPVITGATSNSVSGTGCAGCVIEVFVSATGNTGYGPGMVFVGVGTATAGGTFTVPVTNVQVNTYVTTTAIDPVGNTSEFSLNRLVVAPAPLVIQAEDYQAGQNGVTYYDTTAGNIGGAYRSDDVDISRCSTGTPCYMVGAIATGEWLTYGLSIPTTGIYSFTLNIASPYAGKRVRLAVDGTVVGSTLAVPQTGGWQIWGNLASNTVTLTSGQHVLQLYAETTGYNVNAITVNGP